MPLIKNLVKSSLYPIHSVYFIRYLVTPKLFMSHVSHKLSLILIIFISLYICLLIEVGYLKGLETNLFRVAMSLCLSLYSTSLKFCLLK